jgi:hypothetical protein
MQLNFDVANELLDARRRGEGFLASELVDERARIAIGEPQTDETAREQRDAQQPRKVYRVLAQEPALEVASCFRTAPGHGLSFSSFDHSVGLRENRLRDRDAERFGRFQRSCAR